MARYPRHRPSAIKQLKDYLRSRVKVFAWTAGIIATLAGAVTAVANAWPYIEPVWVAHRGYVRDVADDVTHKWKLAQQTQTSILRDLQIEATEGKKSAANNALANWKLEKLKTKDPVTHALIDRQIEEKESELTRLNGQLKTLNTLKAQGQ
jgi:hypothetical protein